MNQKLSEKLASPKGQASIASAMRLLNGRTDFKGQSMLGNKGESDIMFHPRGNFFHYTSQRGKMILLHRIQINHGRS